MIERIETGGLRITVIHIAKGLVSCFRRQGMAFGRCTRRKYAQFAAKDGFTMTPQQRILYHLLTEDLISEKKSTTSVWIFPQNVLLATAAPGNR